jgi:hypothetical protein
MITEKRIEKLPDWIKRILIFLRKVKVPAKIVYILIAILATIWFLIRVVPKPSRAAYPCMQVAAPIMSSFVIWMLALSGAALAFKKAKHKLFESKYVAAGLFLIVGIASVSLFSVQSAKESKASNLEIWYKANQPLGTARGIYPGRVSWGHNPKISTWDGKTGFWWADKYNNQAEVDKLLHQTLLGLTEAKNEKKAWDALFKHFNQEKHNKKAGYQSGEKIAVKINNNNVNSHEPNNDIDANPQLILSLLKSLVEDAKIPQENITVADPSRFITNNIYDKCHAIYPNVHYVDHLGTDGREKATYIENAIPYSGDNGKVAKGLATCIVEANYIIDMALMKGHESNGMTLSAKNFYGCTSIDSDWRNNAHSDGFGNSKEGVHRYSIYPDFLGHKDLGGKTMLFLVDGIYSNKKLYGTPNSKWALAPFNGYWPSSLFASQDGVAVDAVVLDFMLAEWPDAGSIKYSDYSLMESAQADNPPSGTKYDPEQDGTRLTSLGTFEHWNNPVDKQYTRNLKTGTGIELVYEKVN